MPPEPGYWLDRHRQYVDVRAVGYRSRSVGFNRWVYRMRRHTTHALLDRLVGREPTRLRVLDVGSGSGFYLELWNERTPSVELVALDVAPEAVDVLRERFPNCESHVAEVGGPHELPVQGDFDVVECFDVLYHITDDAAFRRGLAQVGARVRPGGHLLLTDNFPASNVTTRPHVRLRSLDSYLEVLSGFEPVASMPQFLFLNVPSGIVSPWLRWPLVLLWELITWPARLEWAGRLLGAGLYGLDRLLLPIVGKYSPSTKLVALRRAGDSGEAAERLRGP